MHCTTLRSKAALLLAATMAACSTSRAADVVLRQRAVAHGPVLRLGDIADVHAASPRELQTLITTPLGPAPRTRQFMRTAEVRDILYGRGVDLRNVRFSGAALVEIGGPGQSAAPASLKLTKDDREQIETAVQAALEQHLHEQSGHSLWSIALGPGSFDAKKLFGAAKPLTVAGGKAPWTGRQQFRIFRPGDRQGTVVTARVRRGELIAFVKRALEPGQLIGSGDVELRPHLGSVPAAAIRSVQSALGTEARSALRVDSILTTNQVRKPLLVSRGETVSVYARTGGVTVRTFAVAKQNGAQGDLVQVETSDGRNRYAAQVRGRRELEVFAAGNSVDDFAVNSPRTAIK